MKIHDLARRMNKPTDFLLIDLLETALDGRLLVINDPNKDTEPDHWSTRGPNDLVDPKEASVRIRLSVSTLAKMRCRGDGPPFVKLGSRSVFYRVRDVDAFLADKHVSSTSAY
ncbi:MAG: hypothetical protein AAF253_02205 [Pseudomonadota bacterium]